MKRQEKSERNRCSRARRRGNNDSLSLSRRASTSSSSTEGGGKNFSEKKNSEISLSAFFFASALPGRVSEKRTGQEAVHGCDGSRGS